MTRAFRDLYGIDDAFGRVEFSGRSDTAIFCDAAREHGVAIEERAFTPDEAYAADEAFLTSASQFVMPIVEILVGDPGVEISKTEKVSDVIAVT